MKKNWSEILSACDERAGTLEEFAKESGVSKAALAYQITRRNKFKKFIPVIREEAKSEVSAVTIEFPSGIKLTVNG
jgi:Zn-dependent peptidase ImmA (M78 family)